jgi:methyltransferase
MVFGAIVFGAMIAEALVARRNERAQRALGGLEPPGDVYAAMRVAYPAVFLAMLAEGAWRGPAPVAALAAGAAVFSAAKALKTWAIVSLGRFWTFRVIVVPGMALVRSGPYRWLRHPNYVAVAGELVGVALATGALVAGPLGTALFLTLIARRIRVEDGAILTRE